MTDDNELGGQGETVELTSKGETGEDGQIRSYHIKSNYFRVVHADGAWGGITPHLFLQMVIFNERRPIPQEIVQPITPSGDLGQPIPELTKSKDGIVREMEVEILMNKRVAKQLRKWLDNQIEQLEGLEEELRRGIQEKTEGEAK